MSLSGDTFNLEVVQDLTQYTAAGYGGEPANVRRNIKKKLDEGIAFAVAGLELDRESMARVANDSVTIQLPFIAEGTVLVMGNADTSEFTYPIKAHKPVCYDMKTGKAVTGINPDWKPSEYKIVGVSLAPLDSGVKLIPVKLLEDQSGAADQDIPFELTSALSADSGQATAKELRDDGGGVFKKFGKPFTVYDDIYGGLEGPAGSPGFAQKINNRMIIKTLKCETTQDTTTGGA